MNRTHSEHAVDVLQTIFDLSSHGDLHIQIAIIDGEYNVAVGREKGDNDTHCAWDDEDLLNALELALASIAQDEERARHEREIEDKVRFARLHAQGTPISLEEALALRASAG